MGCPGLKGPSQPGWLHGHGPPPPRPEGGGAGVLPRGADRRGPRPPLGLGLGLLSLGGERELGRALRGAGREDSGHDPRRLGTLGIRRKRGGNGLAELETASEAGRGSRGLMNGPWGQLGASEVSGMEKGCWRAAPGLAASAGNPLGIVSPPFSPA